MAAGRLSLGVAAGCTAPAAGADPVEVGACASELVPLGASAPFSCVPRSLLLLSSRSSFSLVRSPRPSFLSLRFSLSRGRSLSAMSGSAAVVSRSLGLGSLGLSLSLSVLLYSSFPLLRSLLRSLSWCLYRAMSFLWRSSLSFRASRESRSLAFSFSRSRSLSLSRSLSFVWSFPRSFSMGFFWSICFPLSRPFSLSSLSLSLLLCSRARRSLSISFPSLRGASLLRLSRTALLSSFRFLQASIMHRLGPSFIPNFSRSSSEPT